MNLIKKHLKKKLASETDIINEVINELEEFGPTHNFRFDVINKLLKEKVIDYDMTDMPSGEFGDIIIPALADNDSYKKLKDEALNLFEEKGGVDKQEMLWELENEVIHEVQSVLADLAE